VETECIMGDVRQYLYAIYQDCEGVCAASIANPSQQFEQPPSFIPALEAWIQLGLRARAVLNNGSSLTTPMKTSI